MAENAQDDVSVGLDRHLRRLSQATPLLADLSQADVLVMVPDGDGFRVRSHVRPMNARTVYPIDQADALIDMADRPLATRAFRSGEVMDGGIWLESRARWIRTLAVPIRFDDRIVGVLAREFSPSVEAMPGDFELLSFATFRRIGDMIADGSYPFGVETRRHDHPPRVGDGVMLLDRGGRIEFASPNALTVLRQVGAATVNSGRRFGEIGIDAPGVREAFANALDYTDEVELAASVLSMWTIPLVEGSAVTGALVLVRNITELRQRDRLLMTKDATIAEIHHRVKNSLQTASSLLRLQARRVDSEDARAALAESARRIRSIGVVHELLSHRTDDEVQFGQILSTLTSMIRESLVDPSRPLTFEIDADQAVLPNKMTTPLALVASELVQNVIDHAEASHVEVRLRVDPDAVRLEVVDNGHGFPTGFTIDDASLGLTIVRTMVESELGGSLTIGTAGHPVGGLTDSTPANTAGGRVTARVPLFDDSPTT